MDKPSVTLVGMGRVGRLLYEQLRQVGYSVTAVSIRHPQPQNPIYFPLDEALNRSTLFLLTVPDDAIASVSAQIAARLPEGNGRGFVHLSGAHSLDVLEALQQRGAMVGGLHPAFPFAGAVRLPEGVAFAIEAFVDPLRGWLHDLVAALRGVVLDIPAGKKAQYHAALVFASNYLVTLYAVAEGLLLNLGATRSTADAALDALIGATVSNLRMLSVPDALTGPLVRGDLGTILKHLSALDDPQRALYLHLAEQTLPLAKARGIDVSKIEELLKQA